VRDKAVNAVDLVRNGPITADAQISCDKSARSTPAACAEIPSTEINEESQDSDSDSEGENEQATAEQKQFYKQVINKIAQLIKMIDSCKECKD
jgi:hypothetical protein